MKKTKIVIPALGLLLLSTAASVTGTVAWFSSINTVTASTMTIKATVGANLYIAKGASVALASLTGNAVTDLESSSTAVSPADMSHTTGTVTVRYATGYSTAPTQDSAGTGNAWQAAGTLTVTTATDNASPALHLNDYCVYSYVTIARKQTSAGTYDLTPACTITCGASSLLNKSLRCGLLMNDQWIKSDDMDTASGAIAFTFNNQKVTSLEDNTAYSACLVVWFEGEDSDCFTNNAIDLSTNTASWTFTSADHV